MLEFATGLGSEGEAITKADDLFQEYLQPAGYRVQLGLEFNTETVHLSPSQINATGVSEQTGLGTVAGVHLEATADHEIAEMLPEVVAKEVQAAKVDVEELTYSFLGLGYTGW